MTNPIYACKKKKNIRKISKKSVVDKYY